MTTEQARLLIWTAIVARGVAKTAEDIGKSERALRYFAAGGLLGKKTINALIALTEPPLPELPHAAWLAVMGVETASTEEASA